MNYDIQIDAATYTSRGYLSKSRWATYARLIAEVLSIQPKNILEIGPGNGLVTDILHAIGFPVQTLDFDPAVHADIHMSVTDPRLPSIACKYDLVIAAEVLEHIKYEDALMVLRRLHGSMPNLLLTLPYTSDGARIFHFDLKIPLLPRIKIVKKLFYKRVPHVFNGQHYWEIGKDNFPMSRIRSDIRASGWKLKKDFINPENTYHNFFLLAS